jgi:starch phosphorylase
MSGTESVGANEDSRLWTLEEIGRLVSRHGDPSETLTNVAHLIQQRFQTDVCSVYLLEPDRSSLVLAATIGLRSDSVGRVRMRLTEGLAGLVAERLDPQIFAAATTHPRFKYFPESGEDPYRAFLGVPVVDRGLLQGVLIVQTIEARTFGADDVRMLVMAGAQVAPIVSEARAHGQIVAPTHQRLLALAQNLWWSWDTDTTRLFRELDPVLWREHGSNPIALLQHLSIEALEERASQLALHNRINYAYRRMQEYLNSTHTWGARHAGVLWARPVAYFSAEFGLHESVPIYSGGLGILAGDHIKISSDLGVPLVGVGLYYDQGYVRQRLDVDGWQRGLSDVDSAVLPMQPATFRGVPVSITIQTRTGTIAARVWKLAVAATRCCFDSNVEGNSPEDRELTARSTAATFMSASAVLLGVGGVRAERDGHRARRHASERRAQRFCGARTRAPPDGIRDRCARGHPPVAPQVVFTTHTPVPAGHDRPGGAGRGTSPVRCAFAGLTTTASRSRPRQPARSRRRILHDGARAETEPAGNAVSSLHGQVSRSMWSGLFRPLEDRVPIGHVTNSVRADVAGAGNAAGLRTASRRTGPFAPRARFLGGNRGGQRRRAMETHQTLGTARRDGAAVAAQHAQARGGSAGSSRSERALSLMRSPSASPDGSPPTSGRR